jgi:hypothetical protein
VVSPLSEPCLLPGIRIKTSADDFQPLEPLQMMRFKEERWVGAFGELLAARRTNRKDAEQFGAKMTELSMKEYMAQAGKEVGVSRCFEIDQSRIDRFADVTEELAVHSRRS